MEYPIYCINLKERLDRKKHVKKEFKKIDIQPTDVIFLDFYRHKKGGKYGCYDSHMKVWNDFYMNHPDKEMCIIFEDDFELTEDSKLYLKKAFSFTEKNKDKVDILFLHDNFIEYNNNHDKRDISNIYFTRGYGFLAHVYIVTRKYIKSILDKNDNHLPKPNGIQIDIDINMNKESVLYSENIFYCIKPNFIQNNVFESDNYHNIIDKELRKKYNDIFLGSSIVKILKGINLFIKYDHEKTKKIVMFSHKLYSKDKLILY
jgi:GR25 family glycosyltransferase involved in LPS biosynthesis